MHLEAASPTISFSMAHLFSERSSYTRLGYSSPPSEYSFSQQGRATSTYNTSPPVLQESNPCLGEIIGVFLESNCVGYAPSQGRRCYNPIARPNLDAASHLLQLGDNQLRNGESVYQTLRQLAPRVLCRRNHQYQASGLVETWEGRVAASFGAAQSTYLLTPPPSQPAYTQTYSQQSENIRRPVIEQGSDLFTPVSVQSSMQANIRPGRPRRIAIPRPPRPITAQSFTPQPPIPQPPISQPPISQPPIYQPTIIQYATRRPIRSNEDCPICREALVPGQGSRSHSRFLNGPRTTWCMAQCGSSFHADCMEVWRETNRTNTRPNCPCWYVLFFLFLLLNQG